MLSEDRANPPAVTNRIPEATTVMLGLIEAHARMYAALKANDDTAEVGVVCSMAPAKPLDPNSAVDKKAGTPRPRAWWTRTWTATPC